MILEFCLRAIKTKLAVAHIKNVELLLDIIRPSIITLIIANFLYLWIGGYKCLTRSTTYSNPLMVGKNTIKGHCVCSEQIIFISKPLR